MLCALCENLICTAATCMDGIKNAKETDIDCGGPTCPRCPEGKQCMVSGDCQLVHCLRGVCGPLPPECKNGNDLAIFPAFLCHNGPA